MDILTQRVIQSRDFLLLESICALDLFRFVTGSSKLSPRTNGALVLRALIQAITTTLFSQETQVAQLIVMKSFYTLLVEKTLSDPQYERNRIVYIALMTLHFQNIVRSPDLVFTESLDFFHQVIRGWYHIPMSSIRVQLLWTSIHLYQGVEGLMLSISQLLDMIEYEVRDSYTVTEDEKELNAELLGITASTSQAFDDGKFGKAMSLITESHQMDDTASLSALLECIKLLARIDPQCIPQLEQVKARISRFISSQTSIHSFQSNMYVLACSMIKRLTDR